MTPIQITTQHTACNRLAAVIENFTQVVGRKSMYAPTLTISAYTIEANAGDPKKLQSLRVRLQESILQAESMRLRDDSRREAMQAAVAELSAATAEALTLPVYPGEEVRSAIDANTVVALTLLAGTRHQQPENRSAQTDMLLDREAPGVLLSSFRRFVEQVFPKGVNAPSALASHWGYWVQYPSDPAVSSENDSKQEARRLEPVVSNCDDELGRELVDRTVALAKAVKEHCDYGRRFGYDRSNRETEEAALVGMLLHPRYEWELTAQVAHRRHRLLERGHTSTVLRTCERKVSTARKALFSVLERVVKTHANLVKATTARLSARERVQIINCLAADVLMRASRPQSSQWSSVNGEGIEAVRWVADRTRARLAKEPLTAELAAELLAAK